ncbi:M56 family metallopeptidase [Paenibacillus sp. GXUN7292]|uniref:M56 family metallopeptidase n=1 Tax=Paenibacillus sp. GXUN7292 TaxID=3422499 RepID=UPI003D7E2F5A
MTELFIAVLNLSIVASYTAILVMIAGFVLKKLKLPTVFAYALWAIVFIRLIIPLSFESNVSMMPINTNTIPYQYSTAPSIDSGIAVIDQSVNKVIESSLPAAQPANSIDPIDIILYAAAFVWLTGIAVLATYAFISYVRLYRKLSTATKVQGNVFESDRISAPFVLGLIKPKIYLPLGLSGEQLSYIVQHEQTHIRRFDYLTKPIAFLITIIHWFNPLAWLSYNWMIKDMEMSCDESVMKKSKGDARAAYSYALLSMAAKQSGFPSPISFGESDVKGRIRNIMSYKKPVIWLGSLAAALLIIFAVSLLSNPLRAMEPAGQYEQAWKNRTPYIGDAGKVSSISGGLPYPAPFKYDHIQLQTEKEPFGLTVYIAINEEAAAAANGLTPAQQLALAAPEFHRNALLMFGLIGNAGEIVFQIKDEPEESSLFYTREWAQARAEQPLFAETEKRKDFEDFAKKADERVVQDQVTAVVEGFGQSLKQVRIATVPAEQTEALMDQFYAPYVTAEQMAKWKQNMELVPGRELSSPWPERIDIDSIAIEGEDSCLVKGNIIGMASTGEAGKIEVELTVVRENGQWKINSFEEK